MSSATDDRVENESSRILGLGEGTFVVFFLAMVVALVWILSAPLNNGAMQKVIRGLSLIIFIIVFLILYLSDREDQYQGEGDKIQAHDSYIVPRIAITLMMLVYTILSVVFMTFIHFNKVITGSSQEIDSTSLW